MLSMGVFNSLPWTAHNQGRQNRPASTPATAKRTWNFPNTARIRSDLINFITASRLFCLGWFALPSNTAPDLRQSSFCIHLRRLFYYNACLLAYNKMKRQGGCAPAGFNLRTNLNIEREKGRLLIHAAPPHHLTLFPNWKMAHWVGYSRHRQSSPGNDLCH